MKNAECILHSFFRKKKKKVSCRPSLTEGRRLTMLVDKLAGWISGHISLNAARMSPTTLYDLRISKQNKPKLISAESRRNWLCILWATNQVFQRYLNVLRSPVCYCLPFHFEVVLTHSVIEHSLFSCFVPGKALSINQGWINQF